MGAHALYRLRWRLITKYGSFKYEGEDIYKATMEGAWAFLLLWQAAWRRCGENHFKGELVYSKREAIPLGQPAEFECDSEAQAKTKGEAKTKIQRKSKSKRKGKRTEKEGR